MARGTVEGCWRLDVRELARHGWTRPGWAGDLTWRDGYGNTATIGLEAAAVELRLRYTANGEPEAYAVRLDWTPCHYGGSRPWLRCPVLGCGRRVGVLYLAGRVFACRSCYGLAYASQRESDADRALRRRDKINARLVAHDGELVKPPRMHWRTFERLSEAASSAEREGLRAAAAMYAR